MAQIPGEIIRDENAAFLVNSARQACRYARVDGRSLSPGYYLAWSPKWRDPRRYDEHVRYFGPQPTMDIARFLETSARALGLMAGTPAKASAEEPRPAGRAAAGRAKRLARGAEQRRRSQTGSTSPEEPVFRRSAIDNEPLSPSG